MTVKTTTLTGDTRYQPMNYDFFAEEWSGQCGACGFWLYAPTKSEYNYSRWIHTHSDQCLGGY